MTDADYADVQAHPANTSAQAESQLHSPDYIARGIGFYVNVNKTEHMCFKQKGAISSLSGKPLKCEDQFTYLDCDISSHEINVNICLAKVLNAIDRLSII